MEQTLIARKGAIITCSVCHIEIAELIADMFYSEPATLDKFRFIEHQYKEGDPTVCWKCGDGHWYMVGRLHVKNEGWS